MQRVLYRHYMAAVDAVVFVVDSADRERLDEAVDDLFSYIVPTVEEDQVPVLVLANKQDLATVMSPDEIKQAICSRRTIKTREHFCCCCCSLSPPQFFLLPLPHTAPGP